MQFWECGQAIYMYYNMEYERECTSKNFELKLKPFIKLTDKRLNSLRQKLYRVSDVLEIVCLPNQKPGAHGVILFIPVASSR
jgi:hypothetical protein